MKYMEVAAVNPSEKVRLVRVDQFEEFTINKVLDADKYRVHAHSLTHTRTWLLGEFDSEEAAKEYLSDLVGELDKW
ncbi:MAG: hypothetical protein II857_05725 [Selenomonadaceae bacterium]|nr:hypothetical protein [Selenomonadaceae bacterium]